MTQYTVKRFSKALNLWLISFVTTDIQAAYAHQHGLITQGETASIESHYTGSDD